MGLFGNKKTSISYDHEKATLARNLDEAEIRHLEVLRREISNLIVQINPDLMISCYEKGWQFEREVSANPQRMAAEEAALVAKIRMFQDFDIINTRHFVPYAENTMLSDDDLVERYHEISHMLIFMKNRSENEYVLQQSLHDQKEWEVLNRCMRDEKGRDLRKRIDSAMSRFRAYRMGLEKGDPTTHGIDNFEDAEMGVVHLPSYGEIEYGITFKKTEEYAVYSFFVHDDGHVSYSYSRSDSSFKEREYLMK